VSKHVGVIKYLTIVHIGCAFGLVSFIKENKLIKMHGLSNFKIVTQNSSCFVTTETTV